MKSRESGLIGEVTGCVCGLRGEIVSMNSSTDRGGRIEILKVEEKKKGLRDLKLQKWTGGGRDIKIIEEE